VNDTNPYIVRSDLDNIFFMMSATILLVEDELDAAEMLSTFLEMNGFNVISVPDGHQVMQQLRAPGFEFDVAILDIMVPGADGREICQFIRKHPVHSNKPVIFLTAKDAEQDEIVGLNLGADDYIPKPAGLNLILAHVNTLLRRRGVQLTDVVRIWGIEWSPVSGTVTQDHQLLELTYTEYRILELFFRNPKRVFSRQEILEFISDDTRVVFDRTVDVHIKNLRLKLGPKGELIKTYRGLGYGIDRELVQSLKSS
jgi:two-component system phosphate regulon response regulator PhoB